MDAAFVLSILSAYVAAVFGPLAVLQAARRTEQSAVFQGTAMLCAAMIWTVLALAAAQEFLQFSLFDLVLQRFGMVAILAAAVIAVQGFLLSVREWPRQANEDRASRPLRNLREIDG